MTGADRSVGSGTTGVLVYLHGHGSGPSNVHSLLRERAADGWLRVCPAGPVAVGAGAAWFTDGPRGADPASLWSAARLVAGVATEVAGAAGVGLDRVVVGGFSQGAATALAAATVPELAGLGGLLLDAAFVPEPAGDDFPLDAVSAGAVLLQQPTDDDVVPPFMAKDLADALGAAPGVGAVELAFVAGGHVVGDEMATGAIEWLGRTFAP